MDYPTTEYSLAAGLLVCSMFGMGTTLTVADFLQVLRQPLGLVLVLVLQCLVAPTVAVLLAKILGVSPGVAAGMLLMAALPGGSYTNLYTWLGRGNVALSVAATTFCTALCVVTTPLVLQAFGNAQHEIVMPVRLIFSEIGSWLLLPLVAGMTVRRFLPSVYARLGKAAIWMSLALLVAIVVAASTAGRLKLLSEGWRGPAAIIAFGGAMLWVTYGTCLLARRCIADLFTIAIEVVVRNGNLALLLKASLYPDGSTDPTLASGVLYAILFYVVVSLVIATLEVYVRRTNWGVIYGRGRP